MSEPTGVTVYWRPGCPYCMMLRSGLRKTGLAYREIDIWAEPAAAGYVRSVAGGNETVPTVRVGGRALVNPTVRQVLDAVESADPDLARQARPPRPPYAAIVIVAVLACLVIIALVLGGR